MQEAETHIPEENRLEATNRVLRDLERKLSLVLTVSLSTSHQSHGSVIQDPQYGGMARDNIRLSVISYIRNSGSEFDPELVYSDRKQRLITKFDREYSPNVGKSASAENLGKYDRENVVQDSEEFKAAFKNDLPRSSLSSTENPYDAYYDDNLDSYCESDTENDPGDPENMLDIDDDMLLPPLPPRLPPKELDPSRLYGLFDFLGPDPLHCTLFREEPVYLVNDLDNYWWLIRKLTKQERIACNTSGDPVESDEEDGKIGFVPAECLETHGERLARLNCYKNEVLEKSSLGTSPASTRSELTAVNDSMNDLAEIDSHLAEYLAEPVLPLIRRKGSILKKKGSYKRNNKLVTFENLAEFALDDDDEIGDDDSDHDILSYRYYGLNHDDIEKTHIDDPERHSEVLSDVYPVDMPLHIPKSNRETATVGKTMDLGLFSEPKLPPAGDDVSIGTYSPDTPPTQRFAGSLKQEEQSELRRSVILDKLSEVTSLLGKDNVLQEYKELSFGGSLQNNLGVDRKSTSKHSPVRQPIVVDDDEDDGSLLDYLESRQLTAEELSTPLTSSNSLSLPGVSPKLAPPEKKKRSKYEMCLPVLGQLEELTKKLAELEHLFE